MNFHPINMKTGSVQNDPYFYSKVCGIVILGLDGILRKNSYFIASIYGVHNFNGWFDDKILDAGIMFNLHSEYGIGEKLKPLIVDMFKNDIMDYEKHKDNVFYKELLLLVPELVSAVNSNEVKKKSEWLYNYMIKIPEGDILLENQDRLKSFFPTELNESNKIDEKNKRIKEKNKEKSKENVRIKKKRKENNKINENIKEYNEITPCFCNFCDIFRPYYDVMFKSHYPNKGVELINNVLSQVYADILNNKI